MTRKLALRAVGGLALLFALYVGGVLLHGWIIDWKPAPVAPLALTQHAREHIVPDTTLRLVIWNVGFGGNGAESDFFFDDEGMWYSGNSMVRAPRPLVEKNIQGAVDFLRDTPADFYLLQEADSMSDRSYNILQLDAYAQALPDYAATLALNYHCNRVPIPILEPWNAYGRVHSGLATYSRYEPAEAVRYQLPGEYPMPSRIFQLDRCAALHRFKTALGNDLVLINVHNSAYDPGDKIKAIQMPFLRDLALREYQAGNFVILGGDWNQCPPYFRFDAFMPGRTQGYVQGNVGDDLFPDDWRFAYDPTAPTNRKLRNPYVKGQTFETLIDFYLVSPNVQIQKVRGIPQGFQFSDHQPVLLEVTLSRK